jgi:hypothetical protein
VSAEEGVVLVVVVERGGDGGVGIWAESHVRK